VAFVCVSLNVFYLPAVNNDRTGPSTIAFVYFPIGKKTYIQS